MCLDVCLPLTAALKLCRERRNVKHIRLSPLQYLGYFSVFRLCQSLDCLKQCVCEGPQVSHSSFLCLPMFVSVVLL